MARDLVVKKNSKSVTIRPYNAPHEYYIITIEDKDGYNHFVDATKPYIYNYDYYKRDRECWKAMHVISREIADYICAVDYNRDENLPINEPLRYDFPNGKMVTVYHVNIWLVNSYYPPEIINAPTISKKIVGWWYFYDTRIMLTNGKTTGARNIVTCQGK